VTVSASITKIRRLVNDVNSQEFTDAQILTLFGRMQQRFCRATQCEVKVVSLLAPPYVDYGVTHFWEEAYVADDSSFNPFYRDATYSASQAWELEEDQVSKGAYTVTSGTDLSAEEAQHPVPFFLPSDFYAFKGLAWNKKWVQELSMDKMQDVYRDAFTKLGDVVDWFSPLREGKGKAFVSHGVPTTTGAEGYLLLDNIAPDATYTAGNTVTGSESGATATVVDFFTSPPGNEGVLFLKDIKGTFEDNDVVYESTYGSTLNVSACENRAGVYGYDTFDGESATGFHAKKTGTSYSGTAGTADEISFTDGISYIVTFTATLTSGAVPVAVISTSLNGASKSDEGYYTIQVGANIAVFTANETMTGVFYCNTGTAEVAEYTIASLSVKQITNSALANGTLNSLDQLSAVDAELVANVFYAIYSQVPDRPSATSSAVELLKPFRKYVEFGVAERLLNFDGPKKSQAKAAHMKSRYELGVRFVKGLMWKLLADRKLGFSGDREVYDLKPARPRFPDHYPAVEV